MSISDKIKSIRDTVGREYSKPPPEKLQGFQDDLLIHKEATEYLYKRGLTDETIEYFGLGYDRIKKAIAIPIYKKGTLINIKYRFLDPQNAKYINEENAENWIYHERGLENPKEVIVVEGEFDAMSLWQNGHKNVVSASFGKESYGVWIELLDKIPKVYVAMDNDEGGKETSVKMAERIGIEKCWEIRYPVGIKDANQLLTEKGDFGALLKVATPFYQYQFKGVGDIITSLRAHKRDVIKLKAIPDVEIERDWLMIVSGKTNVGKTSYTLNIADELTARGIPTLIMPFERGIDSVGKRFLQIKYNKTIEGFQFLTDVEWEEVIGTAVETPAYFAVPDRQDIVETIKKAKRIFGVQVVIIDHLDYIVRHVQGNREAEIANSLQNLKRVAEECGVVVMIVTHIRKIDSAGAVVQRKPSIEDLKGSSSLYQDPECVILLSSETEGQVTVEVAKNKGKMSTQTYTFDESTGRLTDFNDF